MFVAKAIIQISRYSSQLMHFILFKDIWEETVTLLTFKYVNVI
jgi:hypothetical protein